MGDDGREERYEKAWTGVRSTAGAVPVTNAEGKVVMEKVKVTRHIAGKAPAYANSSSSESDDDESVVSAMVQKAWQSNEFREVVATPVEDRRLARLSSQDLSETRNRRFRRPVEAKVESEESDESGEKNNGRRVHVTAAIVEKDDLEKSIAVNAVEATSSVTAVKEDEEEDEDAAACRRQRMRLRAAARAKEDHKATTTVAEDELAIEDEDEEVTESEESGTEWETDSDSEDDMQAIKPVFVSKNQRSTILARKEQETKDAAKIEAMQAKKILKKEEARALVAKTMQDDLDAQHKILTEFEVDDSDDEAAEEEEFEAWKVRELKRIKREVQKRATEEAERTEMERLRDMSEEDRLAELSKRKTLITNEREKSKYKFGQKYYHRGAFFMDQDEEIYKRDIDLPTLEDHFDKAAMPAVMQVKKFGFMGQTKYTNLRDQDTSSNDNSWSLDPQAAARVEAKRAGQKNTFERPRKKGKTA